MSEKCIMSGESIFCTCLQFVSHTHAKYSTFHTSVPTHSFITDYFMFSIYSCHNILDLNCEQYISPIHSLFEKLWQGYLPNLPSIAWAIHLIPKSHDGVDTICITKMVIKYSKSITEKKVELTETDIRLYIFDHITYLDEINEIQCIDTLEDFLISLDTVKICFGAVSISDSPKNFKNANATIDHSLLTWRHKQCSGMISKGSKCSFCKRTVRAIYDYRKNNKNRVRKFLRLKKRMKIVRQQNLRIRRRFDTVQKELEYCKNKINHVDKETFFEKIDKIDNMSCIQKLLIKECYETARYKRKTSRHYTLEWLSTCLLLHVRSPTAYEFLRTNDIIPLPHVSTIKKYLSRENIQCGLDKNFFSASSSCTGCFLCTSKLVKSLDSGNCAAVDENPENLSFSRFKSMFQISDNKTSSLQNINEPATSDRQEEFVLENATDQINENMEIDL